MIRRKPRMSLEVGTEAITGSVQTEGGCAPLSAPAGGGSQSLTNSCQTGLFYNPQTPSGGSTRFSPATEATLEMGSGSRRPVRVSAGHGGTSQLCRLSRQVTSDGRGCSCLVTQAAPELPGSEGDSATPNPSTNGILKSLGILTYSFREN